MSNNAKNSLAPPDASDPKNIKKRKMTSAIIEDQEKEKEVYEFLEDDDDYEEFECDEIDYDDIIGAGHDVDMTDSSNNNKKGEDFDKKLW